MIAIIEKLKVKSPLNSSLAWRLTCFDPKVVLHPNLDLKHIDIAFEEMSSACRVTENSAKLNKKQYIQLVIDAQSELKMVFTELINDSENKGLDEFYYSAIGSYKNFHELSRIMKFFFIIFHGNTSVKSGLCMNKSVLVNNLKEGSCLKEDSV